MRQLKVSKVVFLIDVGLSYIILDTPCGGVSHSLTCVRILNFMSFPLKGIFYSEVVVK